MLEHLKSCVSVLFRSEEQSALSANIITEKGAGWFEIEQKETTKREFILFMPLFHLNDVQLSTDMSGLFKTLFVQVKQLILPKVNEKFILNYLTGNSLKLTIFLFF